MSPCHRPTIPTGSTIARYNRSRHEQVHIRGVDIANPVRFLPLCTANTEFSRQGSIAEPVDHNKCNRVLVNQVLSQPRKIRGYAHA